MIVCVFVYISSKSNHHRITMNINKYIFRDFQFSHTLSHSHTVQSYYPISQNSILTHTHIPTKAISVSSWFVRLTCKGRVELKLSRGYDDSVFASLSHSLTDRGLMILVFALT